MSGERHDWELMGGGGGWEVWECRRCGRSSIPTTFGFMLPSLLGYFLRRFRCVPVAVDPTTPKDAANASPAADPAVIALRIVQSEPFLWLMAGSGHAHMQIAALRKAWAAYRAAGGKSWPAQ